MLTFNEELHEYRWNGVVVPGISKIIEPMYDFRFVSAAALERSRELGKAVHLTIEYHERGELDEANTPPALLSYLTGWKMFCADMAYKSTMMERRVYHPGLRVAGQLDGAGTMHGNDQWLIDIKTGDKYPGHRIQTMGYKLLGIEEKVFTRATKRACVYLEPEGYNFEPYDKWDSHDEPMFLSLVTQYRWNEVNNKRRPA